MGRRKSYDRVEVLGKAMRLFWERGFHATSTRELAETMGVNVYSLYAEFGSKEGLYEAAVQHYGDTVVQGHFGGLEGGAGGVDAVCDVLRYFGEVGRTDDTGLGCLLTNAIAERAPDPPGALAAGGAYTDRLLHAFEAALDRAVAAGQLRPDTPVRRLSRAAVTTLLGIFVLLRMQADADVMRDAAEALRAQIGAHRTQA